MRSDTVLDWIRGPRVLDVGCAAHVPEPGNPQWVHGRIKERFPGVIGIDVDAANIAALHAQGFDEIRLGDAETFAFEERFDTIFAGELIEHLSNPGRFLERSHAHLAPGGRLVLTTPNPFSLLYTLYALVKFPRTCENRQHTCWFCIGTLTELTRRAGFRVAHWGLMEDYRFDIPSRPYTALVWAITLFGWLLPARLRCNTMLFVLEAEAAATP